MVTLHQVVIDPGGAGGDLYASCPENGVCHPARGKDQGTDAQAQGEAPDAFGGVYYNKSSFFWDGKEVIRMLPVPGMESVAQYKASTNVIMIIHARW